MSVDMIQSRLDSYACVSQRDSERALREIAQEIILGGLSRTEFFKKAIFHGGTCLRICHGLQRFSEDLDFALREPDCDFNLEYFLEKIIQELEAYGLNLTIQDRSKADRAVKKAFLKDNSLGKILELHHESQSGPLRMIKIKVEVDTNPAEGGVYQSYHSNFPFAYTVITHDMPSLFAGKTHALLCREYIKGRDWYDFLWYMNHSISMNWSLLQSSLYQNGCWEGLDLEINEAWWRKEMERKICSLDWNLVTRDVSNFIRPDEEQSLERWNQEFFLNALKA